MTIQRPVEYEDVQGLLRFGYRHLTEASFLLLRVRNQPEARAWLAQAPAANAVAQKPAPDTALHIALSSAGLHALGVDPAVIEGFSAEFVAGLGGDASRARRLGDRGNSDPEHWAWGGRPAETPHVLVMLYAKPARLAAWQRTIEAELQAGFELLHGLRTSTMDSTEPFGFADGISQPQLDWDRLRPARDDEQFAYTNHACLGEFLLGYPNEYGGYTDRPLLDAVRSPNAILPRAEDDPHKSDLGRNGSYLVMRQLEQDVDGFWRFIDSQAPGDAERRRQLSEAMVGRTRTGEPLVGTRRTIPGVKDDLNAFTFDDDPDGHACPFGAHIRRSNPRNADLPAGGPGVVSRLIRRLGFGSDALRNDLVASTRFHRLLRRGRAYGGEPGEARGIHFICLGANIARQFEFVQGAWLAGTKFDGLNGESDPLLGNRLVAADGTPTDGFSMPSPTGADRCLAGLPPFVTVRGGGYFFLPGIRALRYLVRGPQ